MAGVFACDTFIALPPATRDGSIIFGMNSDHPHDQVEELAYFPSADHPPGSTLECTYISIDQVARTYSVIICRAPWTWGAEMGANEHGVVIGNEAIWSKIMERPGERLLGADLVRLGLERGSTARETLDVITSLLLLNGQGGQCFEDKDPEWASCIFENSFIIADRTEGWVLETAGRHWAAKKVTSGVINISNMMSLGSDIDLMSDGLKECAIEKGLWDPALGEFNFAKAFNTRPKDSQDQSLKATADFRWAEGKKLMEQLAADGEFTVRSMFRVLRDEEAGICWAEDNVVSASSQVSILTPPGSSAPCVHWFTGTPNPARSIFKPFVFTKYPVIGDAVVSPKYGDRDPVNLNPRFSKVVDRRHDLYRAHEVTCPFQKDFDDPMIEEMKQLEERLYKRVLRDAEEMRSSRDDSELSVLFKDAVQMEMKLYQ